MNHPLPKLALAIPLSFVISSSVLAEVYKHVDENGKVTYTDTPSTDAEAVELTEPNSLKPVAIPVRTAPLPDPAIPTYRLRISSPSPGSSVSGLNSFEVKGTVEPSLKPNHQIQLLIDSENHSSSRSTSFSVSGLSRGEHTLQLTIIDENDTLLNSSPIVTIIATRPGNLITEKETSVTPTD
ncbi:DUF4124 domain-containing protein [Oceanicoccus sp. KOV_DT_Chl]|uniref:DUF4124 domain-containing protein n=1 Tax=Oceanicoccus sp. KOV_DT_Chl TaxID=1904639 RepID=UPI000C7AAE56|nr:DUF4124 domain-containing protein [Oceanicoccus sp. KOV_DT_Chl]